MINFEFLYLNHKFTYKFYKLQNNYLKILFMKSIKYCIFLIATLVLCEISDAQIVKSTKEKTEYTKVLTERSRKIVSQLHIENTAKKEKVIQILVGQYKGIGKIFDLKNAEKNLVKEADLSNDATALQNKFIELMAQTELEKLHRTFFGQLSARLTPEQVAKIKDGMTYGVLEVTYKSYIDMIPDLTPEQKTYIKANLIEAREYSMDGGSSKEKHWWFGKYKGRINNYLSKEGYDLDEERAQWKKRREAAKNK